MLMLFVVFHRIRAQRQSLLGPAVGLFSVSGLLAMVLARQDGARHCDAAAPDASWPSSAGLAAGSARRSSSSVRCGRTTWRAFWFGLERLMELALHTARLAAGVARLALAGPGP